MYIAGRLRTASSPLRTVICSAVYSFNSATILILREKFEEVNIHLHNSIIFVIRDKPWNCSTYPMARKD
jgi:hypothetical protein